MAHTNRTDDALIAAYAIGEIAAFEELMARHLPAVYSFALRHTSDSVAAEDISQDVWLKIWKNLYKYNSSSSRFSTWILAIARNTAIDYLRKRKDVAFSSFTNEDGDNVLLETLADEEPLPDALVEKAQDAQALAELLTTLTYPQREILILHYTNGLTFEEIGQVLGEPLNTVKSRHRRAVMALREAFAHQK